jgi:hypothetical protein
MNGLNGLRASIAERWSECRVDHDGVRTGVGRRAGRLSES